MVSLAVMSRSLVVSLVLVAVLVSVAEWVVAFVVHGLVIVLEMS